MFEVILDRTFVVRSFKTIPVTDMTDLFEYISDRFVVPTEPAYDTVFFLNGKELLVYRAYRPDLETYVLFLEYDDELEIGMQFQRTKRSNFEVSHNWTFPHIIDDKFGPL